MSCKYGGILDAEIETDWAKETKEELITGAMQFDDKLSTHTSTLQKWVNKLVNSVVTVKERQTFGQTVLCIHARLLLGCSVDSLVCAMMSA